METKPMIEEENDNIYEPLDFNQLGHITSIRFPQTSDSFYTRSYTDPKKRYQSYGKTSADSTPNFIGTRTLNLIPTMVVITGQNGQGKTMLLKHIRESLRHKNDELIFFLGSNYAIPEQGSVRTIRKELEYDKNIKFLSNCLDNNSLNDRDEVVKTELDKILLQNLRSYQQQHPAFSNESKDVKEVLDSILQLTIFETLEDIKSYDPLTYLHLVLSYYKIRSDQITRDLEGDGKNINDIKQTILKKLGENPRDVMNDAIRNIISGYKIAELDAKYSERDGSPISNLYKCEMVNTNGKKIPFDGLSSGESLMLELLTIWQFSFFNPNNLKDNKVKIMLLDEPDKHLDPNLGKLFIETIRKEFVEKGIQVIMTTHSINTVAFAKDEELFTCKKQNGRTEIFSSTRALATLKLTKNTRDVSHLPVKVYTEAINDALFYNYIYKKMQRYSQEIRAKNGGSLFWSELYVGNSWKNRVLSERVQFSFHSTSTDKLGQGGGVKAVIETLNRDILAHEKIKIYNPALYSTEATKSVGLIDMDFGTNNPSALNDIFIIQRHSVENFLYDPLVLAIVLPASFDYTDAKGTKKIKINKDLSNILNEIKKSIESIQENKVDQYSILQNKIDSFFDLLFNKILNQKDNSDKSFYKDNKQFFESYANEKEIESEKVFGDLNSKISKIIKMEDSEQKNELIDLAHKIINRQTPRDQNRMNEAWKNNEESEETKGLLTMFKNIREFIKSNVKKEVKIILDSNIIISLSYPEIFFNVHGHELATAISSKLIPLEEKKLTTVLLNFIEGSRNIPIPCDLAETFFELNSKLREQMNLVIKADELEKLSSDQLLAKGYSQSFFDKLQSKFKEQYETSASSNANNIGNINSSSTSSYTNKKESEVSEVGSDTLLNFQSHLLSNYGIKSVNVPGDGNCFFHAVEDQLRLINGNIVMNYQQIRNFAVQYINSHRQEFQDFIVDENIGEYLNRISQDRQWADHNLIQALSNELRINIVIIGNNHIGRPLVIGSSEFLQTIYLGHIVELHYVSLQMVSDNEEYYNNFIQLEELVRLELEGSNRESPSEQKTEESSTNNHDLQVWKIKAIYDNSLLNHNHLLTSAYKIAGMKAVNYLLELGQDKEVAEQILLAVDDIGVEKVLEIFFSPVKSTDLQTIQQPYDGVTLEIIAKIETIIGKDVLTEIKGWYKYASAALSNNPLSASATKVIQIIGNLVNNLEEWLDFGIAYESIEIETQVTIILSQLEHWFDFVASGTTFVGLPPRYPGFDPDDDSNGGSGGGSSGSQGLFASSDNENQNEPVATFLVGLNTTAMLDS